MADQQLDPKNMVYLTDDLGETSAFHPSEAQSAIHQGYRPASPEEIHKFGQEIKYGSGVVNPAAAAALGAGRALTFGLSDVALTKTGLVSPETLSGLEEAQPGASMLGEAGAIGASLLVPGYGEATAARAATAPVRAVSRLGQAVTRGVEAALPDATGMLGKAGKIALSHGAGMAAEGALYGAGRSLTDYAEEKLGDPDTAAEKILSTVGMTALISGGLGSALGLTGAAASKGIQKMKGWFPEAPLPEAGPTVIKTTKGPEAVMTAPVGTLERSMQEAGFAADKQAEVLENSKYLKPNAKKIIDDSIAAGLTPLEGQISAKESVQHMQTMLLDRPGIAGEQQRAVFGKSWDRAGKNFEEPFMTGETGSAHEVGLKAKELIADQIDATYKPIKGLYEKLGPDAENILVPENRRMDLMGDLLNKAETAKPGEALGGPRKKLYESWAERVQDQPTLGNFDGLYTEVSNAERSAWRSSNYTEANILSDIKNTIKDFQESIIDEAHTSFLRASGASEEEIASLAKGLKSEREMAKKKYREFVETLGDLSGAVKLGKVRTYREVMQALEKIEPSKLAVNAFRGDRIKALQKLERDFPGAFEIFKNQYKKEFLETPGMFVDGAVNPKKSMERI